MRIERSIFLHIAFVLITCTISQFAFASNQPSIKSLGLVLELSEATIAHGQSVTLLIPGEPPAVKYVWKKESNIMGMDASLKITDFDKSKAGFYSRIHFLTDGTTVETKFKLNYLCLGEDIDACSPLAVDFEVPNGPKYDWSTGSNTNNFRITFEESAKVSVTAVTEFGQIIKDEKIISISKPDQYIEVEEKKEEEITSNNQFHHRA